MLPDLTGKTGESPRGWFSDESDNGHVMDDLQRAKDGTCAAVSCRTAVA